jgi:hypothetical protein
MGSGGPRPSPDSGAVTRHDDATVAAPGPVASFYWLLLLLCMVPAALQTRRMWWLGLIVGTVLVLGILGMASSWSGGSGDGLRSPIDPQGGAGTSWSGSRAGTLRNCGAPNPPVGFRKPHQALFDAALT